jgi:NAD(P)-dependent dehydrogenase (short-subunit alcohol dehydrogenase family)
MQIDASAAIVTGAASGLGLATARMLARHGARVALLDIDAARAAEAAAGLASEHAQGLQCDVGDAASAELAVGQAVAAHGVPRILVNCAGIAPGKRMVGRDGPMPLAEFERVIQVNLIGTFNLMRIAASAISRSEPLEDGERGVLINTASVAAFDGQIGQISYSASKGGVVGMTLPAARDLAPVGIRVCTIAPGLFDTPLLGQLPEDQRQALAKDVVFPRRLGRAVEYAALARHIVENSYFNGEVFRLDGGLRMPPK